MNRQTVAVIVSVVILFTIIVSVTGIAGKYLGKNIEMILLGIVAVVLLVILIKDRNNKE